ncbi:MAG: DUF1570 domain-containing protein [Planctomycetota bacterium]|nr:DUF1570 domain-containing protein [Planctomycetota bacterium]
MNRIVPSLLAALIGAGIGLCPVHFLAGQTRQDSTDESAAASKWRRHQALQQQLAESVEALGLSEAARPWIFERDPQRLYVFTPQEQVHLPGEAKLQTLFEDHANRLFELARQLSDEKQAAACFQTLHEVLFYNPNHAQAREILGHRAEGETWHVASDRLRMTVATRPQPLMNWPGKSYRICKTPHFEIASQADAAETRLLAEKLELWHQVWRQVFFEFWSSPATLQRWMAGKGKARMPTKKFQVIFFKDRDAYVDGLSPSIPGIEASTGYYAPSEGASFFYASDELQDQATWRHELTHQLFRESRRSAPDPFADQFLWLDEGIAMYFESLTEFPRRVVLGGFDGRRLQFARIRALKEQFYVPAGELTSLDQKEFQTHPQVRKVYSQSAGLAHYLMSADHGGLQPKLCEFLRLCYLGKLKEDSFPKIIGLTMEEIDAAYPDFLRVERGQVEAGISAPNLRTELALPRSQLSPTAVAQIGRCPQLIWLDLSASDLRGKTLAGIQGCRQLRQLFLTGCLLDQASLQSLSQLQQLAQLDLSATSLGDDDLGPLANLPALADLNLSGTKISDAAVPALLKLKSLTGINLSGTRLTRAGVGRLQAAQPDLNITF